MFRQRLLSRPIRESWWPTSAARHGVPRWERVRYQLDNTLAGGPLGLVTWLAVFTASLIVCLALVLWLSGAAGGYGPSDLLWMGFQQTLEPTGLDPQLPPALFAAMMVAAVAGLFVTSTLIGIVTTGMQERIEGLREGRSRVVESGHTVVLGWSDHVFPVVSEIVEANSNRSDGCVVILGEADRTYMEGRIRERLGDTGSTRVVCRSGSPIEISDLRIASIDTADAVIILSPETDDPDVRVIKTLLAILNRPARAASTAPNAASAPTNASSAATTAASAAKRHHIVAALRDRDHLDVVRIVGGDQVHVVLTKEVIARIIAQTARQRGLSVIYQELLDFQGDEIYLHSEPTLEGSSFKEALFAYDQSTVMGLVGADGNLRLGPAMDTVIGAGDRLLVIASDDDSTVLNRTAPPAVDRRDLYEGESQPQARERILMLGWNRVSAQVVKELDEYVAAGSQVVAVTDHDHQVHEIEDVAAELSNLLLVAERGRPTRRQVLESVDPETFQQAIIMSDSDEVDAQEADARTLVTLLQLREIINRRGARLPVVTEMLDVRNRDLAMAGQGEDFIVSDRLISLLLTQVAENKVLGAVFDELFSAEGTEIYLRPAADFVAVGREIAYYAVVESAARKGEVALGYRLRRHAEDARAQFGVRLNPLKTQPVLFSGDDELIVLSRGVQQGI